jgi:hypothetical protein
MIVSYILLALASVFVFCMFKYVPLVYKNPPKVEVKSEKTKTPNQNSDV